ncbi:MAG: cupin domain-containing protein [Chloroflexi bacterium]|nr:cupin domain-containing protein [Chloroflexota bacterium]
MQRELERLKEKGPELDIYDLNYKWMMDRTKERSAGKVLIKGEEVPWKQSRHGYGKQYMNGMNWHEMSVPGWMISVTNQRVLQRGMHTHKGGGRMLYVLDGRGYTVNNDVRLDWERGDLEILPVTPFENKHGHYNLDPGHDCGMFVIGYWPFMGIVAYETRQLTDSPDWKGPRNDEVYRPDDFVPEAAALKGYEVKLGRKPADLLDDLFLRRNRWRQQIANARWVVKETQQPQETNRMGIYRWYVHPAFTDVVARHILFWTHEIPPGSRSGVQKHQGGRLNYVVQGRGHSLLDDKRYDWEPGDLLMLPIKTGGVLVQHFNDGDETVRLAVCEPNWYDILGVDMAAGFEQIEDCPEYKALKKARA